MHGALRRFSILTSRWGLLFVRGWKGAGAGGFSSGPVVASGSGSIGATGAIGATGKVGAAVSTEHAAQCARRCAINALAVVRQSGGSLDSVEAVAKLTVFVASAPGFGDQPTVANGASELLRDVFGEAGLGARSAVGMAELPMNAPVEVEFIFALRE